MCLVYADAVTNWHRPDLQPLFPALFVLCPKASVHIPASLATRALMLAADAPNSQLLARAISSMPRNGHLEASSSSRNNAGNYDDLQTQPQGQTNPTPTFECSMTESVQLQHLLQVHGANRLSVCMKQQSLTLSVFVSFPLFVFFQSFSIFTSRKELELVHSVGCV